MSESDTTSDQGGERRAFEALWELYARVGDAHENYGRNHEKTVEARATFHAALKRALSVAQPVAQPVVDQEPASMSDNGSCGSQVSGKPVSAEPDRYKRALEAIIANPGGASAKRIATLALGLDGTEPVSAEATPAVKYVLSAVREMEWAAAGKGLTERQALDFAGRIRTNALAAPMPQPEGKPWDMKTAHEKAPDLIAQLDEESERITRYGGSGDALLNEAARVIEALTQPQPEPTSKGAKLLAAINAGTAFADGDAEAAWIAHSEHLNCPACGGSGHVEDVSSQQREPQEAAEGKP